MYATGNYRSLSESAQTVQREQDIRFADLMDWMNSSENGWLPGFDTTPFSNKHLGTWADTQGHEEVIRTYVSNHRHAFMPRSSRLFCRGEIWKTCLCQASVDHNRNVQIYINPRPLRKPGVQVRLGVQSGPPMQRLWHECCWSSSILDPMFQNGRWSSQILRMHEPRLWFSGYLEAWWSDLIQ